MVSPMLSACGMALAINTCSNLLAQRLKAWHNNVPFIFDRTLFFQFLIMAVITTPPNYLWQGWLESTFPGWRSVKKRDLEQGEAVEMNEKRPASAGKDGYEHKRDENGSEEVLVRDWFNVFKKWFTDCIFLGAIWNTVVFLVLMGLLKGKSGAQIGHDVRTQTWPIIWNSYKVWPIANFVSTAYIPVEKRIVFLSVCGLVWGIYMSIVAGEL